MDKYLTQLKTISLIIMILVVAFQLNAQDAKYKKGVVRIKFEKSIDAQLDAMRIQKSSDGVVRTGFQSLDKLSEKYGATKMRRVFPYAGKYEAKHRKHGLHLWYELVLDDKADAKKAREEYSKSGVVAISENIYAKSRGVKKNTSNAPLGSLPGGTNDPQYSSQWHYNNTGQSGGTVDADIDLPEAWAIQTGSADVIVSVHDGGIDIDHEDLEGNIWVNPGEIAGNGIDDDNNGFVDDVNGYDFDGNTGTITADSHGTHVAGTIAAETNNGIGMSGVAGGTGEDDGIRLMSCQVFGAFSSGGFANSYIYAADNGSVISQNSWGYTNPGAYEQAVLDAIDYFIAEAGTDENGNQIGPMAGGLVIFAAGNDGADDEWYPGYYDAILSVAGTDHNDNKYTSSNHGAWVELAAPAVNIFSTVPNNSYTGGYNGTSMACPHVSGVAALILSHFKDDGITPQQIWDRLVNSTDPLTFDGAEDWGTGRVNAFKALAEDDGVPPVAIADMAITDVTAVSVTFSWTAPADQPDNYPATVYDLRWSTSPITDANFEQASQYEISSPLAPGGTEVITIEGLTPGETYYFAVKSADYFGNTSDISNTVTATTDLAPQVVVSGDPSATIDISVSPVGTGSFAIANQGQAELSYSIFPIYLGSVTPSVQSTLIYPGNDNVSIDPVTNYEGVAQLSSAAAQNNNTVSQLNFNNDVANIISYDDGDDEADGSIAVTAGGTPVVWGAATAFDVPDMAGEKFMLSQISAYIESSGSPSTPTSLSIVAGGATPSQGELLLSQDFSNIDGAQYLSVPLEMPLSFNSGDRFWVVFEFPAEPLRLGYDDVTGGNRPGTNLAYLNGEWLDIQAESGWENYVWGIRAIQTELSGLTLDVTEGTLSIGSSQNINVTYDATDITRNGDYNFNLFVISNDPVSPVTKVEATAAVTGIPEPEIAVEPSEINAAIDVTVNPVQTETLTIQNNGDGELFFDFTNPVVETEVSIAPFTGTYPTGKAAPSMEKAPFISTASNPTIPVHKYASTTAYAMEVYPGGAFVSFDTEAPGSYLASTAVSYTAYAGDFAKGDDKNMYIIDNDASSLKKLNIETGEVTTIGGTLTFTDLACDKTSGVMYAVDYADPVSELYTLDLETGAYTLIGTVGDGVMISMACDGDGNLWGLNLDDNIYSIDKTTGAATLVGAAGFDANYAQSMAWDPASGIIYLAAFNYGTDSGELRVLDTETGATELVGAFPGNAEITALGFPGGGSPDFVSVSPLSGTVAANSSTTVEVELDATVLPNGTYNSSLTVYSNDLSNPSVAVPVNLEVSGQIGEISLSTEFIEFGAVFVNGEKEIAFSIINNGIGDLEIASITSNVPMFTTDLAEAATIGMGDSLLVKAKFASTFLGQFNGILTIASNDPANPEKQVTVTATAISPPVISLMPEQIEETLDAGQVATREFVIRNNGLYPLQYSMPGAAVTQLMNNPETQKNEVAFIEGLKEYSDKEDNAGRNGHPVQLGAGADEFGYTWIDSRENGGPVFVWNDISTTGIEILEDTDDSGFDVDLPFAFKFYGDVKSTVTISSNGYLTFGTDGTDYTNDQIPSATEPNDYIAPFWDDLRPSSKRGQIFYQASADKFIVQYHEVGNYPSSTTGTMTFQVVLYPNGNIEYFYNSFALENNASATIGIENADGTIGAQVAFETDYVEDELAVLLMPGKTPFDVTVDNVAGIIQPSGQQTIEVTLDATDLIEDSYINELLITSNDPVNSEVVFTSLLEVIGHPEISVSPESLDFDSVFQNFSSTKMLTIENTGSKNLTVSGISSSDASFVADLTEALTVGPKQSATVPVEYTAINLGTVSADLTIESDDEFGNESLVVVVSGTGIVPPEISVSTDPSPVDVVMNSGDKDTVLVSIANNGGSPLNYVMLKPYYTSVGNVTTTKESAPQLTSKEQPDTRRGGTVQYGNGGPDAAGYTWIDNEGSNEVVYDWMEISEIGTKLDLGADDGVYVTLPFEFPFYNGAYTQMQVASNGYFTFDDDLGSIGGYSNQDIPLSDAPNNLIAVLWDDVEPQNGDGVYMYSNPEYVVIQYNEVPAFWSTGTGTFQAILYANGNVKFQYKDVTNYAGVDACTVGLENEDGTGALPVVFNSSYVKDGLAVLIKSPFVTGMVEAGSTANIDLVIDATNIYDGVYEAPLKVLSNDPVTPTVELPTTLTVVGTPEISVSENNIEFDTLYYVDGQTSDTKEFVIGNSGTKALVIDSLWLGSASAIFTNDVSEAVELAPEDTLVVAVTFTPDAVGEFGNTLNISSDGLSQPVAEVSLLGVAIEPPVFAVSPTDTMKMVLNSTAVEVEPVTVSNSGGSMLDYTANVVYLPNGFSQSSGQVVFNRTEVETPVERSLSPVKTNGQYIGYKQLDEAFVDSIVYDPDIAPDDYYGYNGTAAYGSANRFIVSSASFNLTHVANYYQNNGVTIPVVMEIYAGGSIPGEGTLLTSQEIVNPEASAGANCLIELDEPQTFTQGDVFFVAFNYPSTMEYPAAFNNGVSGVDGVSYWYDVNSMAWVDEDPGYVYKIRAYQADGGTVPSDWLTIAPAEGQVEAGASSNLSLTVDASATTSGYHYAKVVYSSNDPLTPSIECPVQLYVNAVPEVITAPDTLFVDENSYVKALIVATDPDGGALSYELGANYNFVEMTVSNDSATINYSPDYEEAGIHDFVIDIADESGESIEVVVTVVVNNVNRTPALLADIEDQLFFIDDPIMPIDLSAYFADADGEELSYQAFASTDSAFSLAVDGQILNIDPTGLGLGVITVTAVDAEGAYAAASFNVRVRHSENHAPQLIQSIPSMMTINRRPVVLQLDEYFEDIDWDEITYRVGMSGLPSVQATIEGSQLTLSKVRNGMSFITIYADDGRGGVTAVSSIVFVYGRRNRMPFKSASIMDREYSLSDNADKIDLGQFFSDPDNDEMKYICIVEDGSSVAIWQKDNMLEITPKEIGETNIVVYASDENTGVVETRFKASVKEATAIVETEIDEVGLSNYPNPFKQLTTIEYQLDKQADVRLEVMNLYGKTIDVLVDENKASGKYQVEYKATQLSSGIYLYRLTVNGKSITKRMIVK